MFFLNFPHHNDPYFAVLSIDVFETCKRVEELDFRHHGRLCHLVIGWHRISKLLFTFCPVIYISLMLQTQFSGLANHDTINNHSRICGKQYCKTAFGRDIEHKLRYATSEASWNFAESTIAAKH